MNECMNDMNDMNDMNGWNEIKWNGIHEITWKHVNLSKIDGAEPGLAEQALSEARTPPLGSGDRVILLKNSPFCNGCNNELANNFEIALELIPHNSHLVLCNTNKPDGRLKTTKALKQLIKNGWKEQGRVKMKKF